MKDVPIYITKKQAQVILNLDMSLRTRILDDVITDSIAILRDCDNGRLGCYVLAKPIYHMVDEITFREFDSILGRFRGHSKWRVPNVLATQKALNGKVRK